MKKFSLKLGIVAVGLAGSPAIAGDTAELNILGFSGDSSIFAFEEYGVQDGSGFPYSTIYVIDTSSADLAEVREVASLLWDAIPRAESRRGDAEQPETWRIGRLVGGREE